MIIPTKLDMVRRHIVNGELSEASALCPAESDLETLRCQWSIGCAYYKKEDFSRAIDHFMKIVEFKNDPDTLFWIGCSHYEKKEYIEARFFFEKAAAHGFVRAWHWVAAFYHFGLGVPIDLNKALTLYAKSREHGFLAGERGIYSIASKNGNIAKVLFTFLKKTVLSVRAGNIAFFDINDQRLVDLSDGIEQMKRDQRSPMQID